MGREFIVTSLEDMCDLMCDNRIPSAENISLDVIEDIINEITRRKDIAREMEKADGYEYYGGKVAGLESALKVIQEKCGVK